MQNIVTELTVLLLKWETNLNLQRSIYPTLRDKELFIESTNPQDGLAVVSSTLKDSKVRVQELQMLNSTTKLLDLAELTFRIMIFDNL